MAVVLGTNAGFVTEAPTADPSGTGTYIDFQACAVKDTSDATADRITEVGWWCDTATAEANFEIGLYAHDSGNDKPGSQLYADIVNAKGVTTGWKTVTVNWSIDPSTIYWIALQVDNTPTATDIDRNSDATRISIKTTSGALADPWPSESTETVWARAIYALWVTATAGGSPIILPGMSFSGNDGTWGW